MLRNNAFGVVGLTRRYVFKGNLRLLTAMHIGGGSEATGSTNRPVLRTAAGQPFIPGSSLKGAFRSSVEKMCAAIAMPRSELDAIDASAPWIRAFHERREREQWSDDQTLDHLNAEWPPAALLFGNQYLAGKILFDDLYMSEAQSGWVERRDGVAIDRDSERALDGLKFDFEVVPSTLVFDCEIRLEDPTDLDIQLTCLGLSELTSGFMDIGGMRSRGLGHCQLENLQIYTLDLGGIAVAERARRLSQYLTGTSIENKMAQVADAGAFVQAQIEQLLNAQQM